MKQLSIALVFISVVCQAQPDSALAVQAIHEFQQTLDKEYRDRSTSPLTPADFKKFNGHDFFPTDMRYVVTARLTYTPDAPFVGLPTTTSRITEERSYAVAEFELDGTTYRLTIYQNKRLMQTPGYEDYLFLPFTDLTNGDESYGGGRYIDLRIPPEGATTLTLNFHLAYNPYCAYNHQYSCPLVPKANHLNVAVRAGVRMKQ